MRHIILFDGDCNFCDKSVQFIIKRDSSACFKFASLQSDIGKKLMKQYHIPESIDSLILMKNNKWYDKSSAVLHICKNLNHVWKTLYLFMIIPKPIRDFFYSILAKNRYQLFGKKHSCMLPSADMRKRFL